MKFFKLTFPLIFLILVSMTAGCPGPNKPGEQPASDPSIFFQLDEKVEEIEDYRERADNTLAAIPQPISEAKLFDFLYSVGSLYRNIESARLDIDGIELPEGIEPNSEQALLFEKKKRVASDLAIAQANYVYSKISAEHFKVIGVTEEGSRHELFAEKMAGNINFDRTAYREAKPAKPQAEDSTREPQFVFLIVIDALRADHLGCYGYSKNTTPNIDRLAETGMLFENAVSQASYTDTSVASLLTSLYPGTHKMFKNDDWLYETSLVKEFQKSGFLTAGFSANALVSSKYHFNEGFDYFEDIPYNRATLVINQAIRWIKMARSTSDKIFVYIHLIDPHDLYFAPVPFTYMFNTSGTRNGFATAHRLRKNLEKHFMGLGAKYPECDFDPYNENLNNPGLVTRCLSLIPGIGSKIDINDILSLETRYNAEIYYADGEIARLLNELDRKGMTANSMVAVTADHGESFLEHNRFTHGRSLYDNEIRVPLILWHGGHSLGGHRDLNMVELVDVMPTLLGVHNIDIPTGSGGGNLLGTGRDNPKQTAFSMSWNGYDLTSGRSLELSAARDRKFKYIRTLDSESRRFVKDEFYRVSTDPKEFSDARKKYPEDFRRLKTELDNWLISTNVEPPRPVRNGISGEKAEDLKELGYIQ